MQLNEPELLARAQEHSWWMFDVQEISILCNVPQVIVNRIKSEADSPFFLDRCRPEWIVEWMRKHPNFHFERITELTTPSKRVAGSFEGLNPWNEARRAGGGRRDR